MQEWLSLNLYEFSYKTDSCGAATLDLSGGGVFYLFLHKFNLFIWP